MEESPAGYITHLYITRWSFQLETSPTFRSLDRGPRWIYHISLDHWMEFPVGYTTHHYASRYSSQLDTSTFRSREGVIFITYLKVIEWSSHLVHNLSVLRPLDRVPINWHGLSLVHMELTVVTRLLFKPHESNSQLGKHLSSDHRWLFFGIGIHLIFKCLDRIHRWWGTFHSGPSLGHYPFKIRFLSYLRLLWDNERISQMSAIDCGPC